MSRRSIIFYIISLILFLLLVAYVSFSSGTGADGSLNYKASTSGLSGIDLYVVNLYNHHRFLLAILTTLIMGIVGIVISTISDYLMKLFGFKISKIEHRE